MTGYWTRKALLESLMNEAHQTAVEKGWHEKDVPFTEQIALIHSEVSEALEADRKYYGKDKVAEELADIIIRTMDTAATHGLDLPNAILEKMEKNKSRPYRHGGLKY